MKLYGLFIDSGVDYECSCETLVAITDNKDIADLWERLSLNTTVQIYELNRIPMNTDFGNEPYFPYAYNDFSRMPKRQFASVKKNNPRMLNYNSEEVFDILNEVLANPAKLADYQEDKEMIRRYKCSNPECKHEFEKNESMGDRAQKKCPECKKWTLDRQIEANPIHLKGSGFSKSSH